MRLVAVQNLRPDMVVGKTIIGSNGQILLRQGVKLTERYIAHLKQHMIEVVYISTGSGVAPQDVVKDQTRIKALSETRQVLSRVKRGAELEVEQVHQILVSIIDELLLQDSLMINLVDIRSHDEELFHHSINVAILSTIVGIEFQYTKDRLRVLATSALLHDIGKLFTEDHGEHVRLGSRLLREKSTLDASIIAAVYQHHEYWDGTGFPAGIGGTDISQDARILSITNVFDYMSTNSRYPLEEVIEYLMGQSGIQFDPVTVRAFLNCVSFYPVGAQVELNTGETGVVVRSNRGFPTRPVVQVERNQFGVVNPPYEVDLASHPTYFVRNRLDSLED